MWGLFIFGSWKPLTSWRCPALIRAVTLQTTDTNDFCGKIRCKYLVGHLRSGKAVPSDTTSIWTEAQSWSFSTSAILIRTSFNQPSFDPCGDTTVTHLRTRWFHSHAGFLPEFSDGRPPCWRTTRGGSQRRSSRFWRPSAASRGPSASLPPSGAASRILLSLPGAAGQSASAIKPISQSEKFAKLLIFLRLFVVF